MGGEGGLAATKVYNPFPTKVYLPAGGNNQPSPRRGASPPLRGLSQLTAPAPSGAGEEAEGRAGVGGLRSKELRRRSQGKWDEERTCTTWVALTQCYLLICALIGSFLGKCL